MKMRFFSLFIDYLCNIQRDSLNIVKKTGLKTNKKSYAIAWHSPVLQKYRY